MYIVGDIPILLFQAFHKTLADIVKGARSNKKGWNSRQNRRYRRLNDNNARHIMAAMKEYEQKLELSMRRTHDMNAQIVCMAEEDIRHQIIHARTLLKDLTSLSENVLTTGFKEKFHMVTLQKSRVQSMLRMKTATAAYESLVNPKGHLSLNGSFSIIPPRVDFLKSFAATKMAAGKFMQTLGSSRTASAPQPVEVDDKTPKNLLVLWARHERRILTQVQDAEPTVNRAASNLRRLRSDARASFGQNDDSYAMETFMMDDAVVQRRVDSQVLAWASSSSITLPELPPKASDDQD